MADVRGPLVSAEPLAPIVVGAVYNTVPPAPADEQGVALQADSEGNLLVNVVAGGGSGGNAAAGPTGSPVPADADYIGFNSGGTLVGVSVANPLPVSASVAPPTGTQTVIVVGTSTVTVAGNVTINSTPTVAVAGTSTVEVAGIVGTSTVTVAGTVTVAATGTQTVVVAGTSTVEVAGIVGTSTVTVAGTVTVAATGTQTVVVAGTSTVEVAGIVGTSTVTVAGNVTINSTPTVAVAGTSTVEVAGIVGTSTVVVSAIVGTSTVEVAGIVGTSTVTIAGNVTINSTPTVAVAGTSTVEVAGIVGTSTVTVAGTVTVAATGTQTVVVAGTSTVEVAGIVGTSTVTIAGNVTINSTPTVAVAGTSTVEVAGIVGTSTVTIAGTSTIVVTGTSTVVVEGVYNTTEPSPANTALTPFQQDQAANLLQFPGVQFKAGTAWPSGTTIGTLQYPTGTTTQGALSGAPAYIVQLDQTTTITGGAVTFQGTYDNINWVTIPTAQVISPSTFAQLTNPYTLVANTNQPFLILANGYVSIRANVSTQTAGTGSVTPYWSTIAINPNVVAVTGTATVTVAGIAGTSTVEVAGIVGTSTVVVSAVVGTSTVEVAGIVGTSTVTIAGNVTINSTPTVAVAGTSTVEVAGIVGTSTVTVAGSATVVVTGQIAGPVAAGTAASSSVLMGVVYNTSAPGLSNGQQVAVQSDSQGSARINPFGPIGGFKNNTVSSTITASATLVVAAATKWNVKSIRFAAQPSNTVTKQASIWITDAGNNVIWEASSPVFTPTNTLVYEVLLYPGAMGPVNTATAFNSSSYTQTVQGVTFVASARGANTQVLTLQIPELFLGPSFQINAMLNGAAGTVTATLSANALVISD